MEWHRNLCEAADVIFISNVMSCSIEDTDPKRVVLAHSELGRYNRSKEIKELLGIPVDRSNGDKKTKAKKKQKTQE
jgi:hypothetical protein